MAMPSRWRSRIIERSNSATAPRSVSSRLFIGESSPVKDKFSFTNRTVMAWAVSILTMRRRSSTLRARPVHTVHDQRITVTQVVEHERELRPLGILAAAFVRENLVEFDAVKL